MHNQNWFSPLVFKLATSSVFLRFRIMTQCWRLEPTHLPTFRTIAELIQNLLPDHTQQVWVKVYCCQPPLGTTLGWG